MAFLKIESKGFAKHYFNKLMRAALLASLFPFQKDLVKTTNLK